MDAVSEQPVSGAGIAIAKLPVMQSVSLSSQPDNKLAINYTLSADAKVYIVVKNARGGIVKWILEEVDKKQGENQETWDGRDSQNRLAPNGSYTLTIGAAGMAGNRLAMNITINSPTISCAICTASATPASPTKKTTGNDGKFDFWGLKEGDYQITISFQGSEAQKFNANIEGRRFIYLWKEKDGSFSYRLTRTDKNILTGRALILNEDKSDFSKLAISANSRIGYLNKNGDYYLDEINLASEIDIRVWNKETQEEYEPILGDGMFISADTLEPDVYKQDLFLVKINKDYEIQYEPDDGNVSKAASSKSDKIEITGIIKDQSSGVPVKNAVIISHVRGILGKVIIAQAHSNENGQYELLIDKEMGNLIKKIINDNPTGDILNLAISHSNYMYRKEGISKSFASGEYTYNAELIPYQGKIITIFGKLKNKNGMASVGRSLYLYSNQNEQDKIYWSETKEGGKFLFHEHLIPGKYKIGTIYVIENEDGKYQNKMEILKEFSITENQNKIELSLEFDETKDIGLTTKKRPIMTGRIVNVKKPVHAEISWVAKLGEGGFVTTSESDGSFYFTYDAREFSEKSYIEIKMFGYKEKIIPIEFKRSEAFKDVGDISLEEEKKEGYHQLKLLLIDDTTKSPIDIFSTTGTLLRVDGEIVHRGSVPNEGFFVGHENNRDIVDVWNAVWLFLTPGKHTISITVEDYETKELTVDVPTPDNPQRAQMTISMKWKSPKGGENCKVFNAIWFCFFGKDAERVRDDNRLLPSFNKISETILKLRKMLKKGSNLPEVVVIDTSTKELNAAALTVSEENYKKRTMFFYQWIFYKKDWRAALESITTHEFMHLYDYLLYPNLLSHNINFRNKYDVAEFLSDIYHWLTDSTFTGIGGHPQDNPRELFASDGHAYFNYNDRFIKYIQELKDQPSIQAPLIFNYKFIHYEVDVASDDKPDYSDPFPCGNIFSPPYFDANKDGIWEKEEIINGDFLKCGVSITGTVADKDDPNTKIERATVSLSGEGGTKSATSDAAGKYMIEVPKAGKYKVNTVKSGYDQVEPASGAEIEIKQANQTQDIKLKKWPFATVEGTVMDGDKKPNQPLPGAWVREGSGNQISVDGQGRYKLEIPNVVFGNQYTIYAGKDGYDGATKVLTGFNARPATNTQINNGYTTSPVDFVLTKTQNPPPPPTTTLPTVTLSATPTSSLAAVTATLKWSSSNASSCAADWTSLKTTSGSQQVYVSQTTVFMLTCAGSGGSATAMARVIIGVPAPPPPPISSLVAVSVACSNSKPVGWFNVYDYGGNNRYLGTSANGKPIVITNPNSTIIASGQGCGLAGATFTSDTKGTAGQTAVTLTFTTTTRAAKPVPIFLAGRVTDKDNNPVANAKIWVGKMKRTIWTFYTEEATATTNADGYYYLELTAGKKKMTVTKTGYWTYVFYPTVSAASPAANIVNIKMIKMAK